MDDVKLWAVVQKASEIVLRVEAATDGWVNTWVADNPTADTYYRETAVTDRDYAGIGWSWDETRQRFIRPMPNEPGTWVYSEDDWDWINLDPPPPEDE